MGAVAHVPSVFRLVLTYLPGMADDLASTSLPCLTSHANTLRSATAGTGAGCVRSASSSKTIPPASCAKSARPPIQVTGREASVTRYHEHLILCAVMVGNRNNDVLSPMNVTRQQS